MKALSKPQAATSTSSSGNRVLGRAKSAKQDEFYTQLSDISNELKYYKAQLRGKTILCNCDDPYESNFFKYFALNFNTLGIKKLIATSYVKLITLSRGATAAQQQLITARCSAKNITGRKVESRPLLPCTTVPLPPVRDKKLRRKSSPGSGDSWQRQRRSQWFILRSWA